MFKAIKRGGRAIGAISEIFNASRDGLGLMSVLESIGDHVDVMDQFQDTVRSEGTHISRVFAEFAVHEFLDFEKKELSGWADYFQIVNSALTKAGKVAVALKDDVQASSYGRIKYKADMTEQYFQRIDRRVLPVLDACARIDSVEQEIYNLLPPGEHVMAHHGAVFVLRV